MKLLLYCTKAKPYLYGMYKGFESRYGYCTTYDKNVTKEHSILNGKIVAECDFEVEDLRIVYGKGWETKTIKGTKNIEKLSCVNREQLYQYCKGKGYAIHIKNLHIFDKPKGLSSYLVDDDSYNNMFGWAFDEEEYSLLKKAPQNMMYAYEKNGCGLIKHILISIRPEWLCKILNGEKTIEVRKKVLKEMLK